MGDQKLDRLIDFDMSQSQIPPQTLHFCSVLRFSHPVSRPWWIMSKRNAMRLIGEISRRTLFDTCSAHASSEIDSPNRKSITSLACSRSTLSKWQAKTEDAVEACIPWRHWWVTDVSPIQGNESAFAWPFIWFIPTLIPKTLWHFNYFDPPNTCQIGQREFEMMIFDWVFVIRTNQFHI